MNFVEHFKERLSIVEAPRILELGTKRSNPKVSTMHRDWVPHASTFLGSDFQEGLDVDIVADVHNLYSTIFSSTFSTEFDAIISCSTLEHIARPWIAMKEIAQCLRKDGTLFIQTHNCFPIHGFPDDYWRFTTSALTMLAEDAGLRVVASDYEFPVTIHSDRDKNCEKLVNKAFLNVLLIAVKHG